MTASDLTYDAAIEYLYGRINYERTDGHSLSTNDFKLDRMRTLLANLGNPQERIPAVHVAGTKGKGSTCSMIASVLSAANLRTGLYISPHINAFEERMTVNGVRPSKDELAALVNRVVPIVEQMDTLPGQMQPLILNWQQLWHGSFFKTASVISLCWKLVWAADLILRTSAVR